MKCPKCGYLGFEQVERCRNCGYDFSLAPASVTPELPIRIARDDSIDPDDDLAFFDAELSPPSSGSVPDAGESDATASEATVPAGRLPLFAAPGGDDLPLITKASPPRPPLSVRRATPDAPRLRTDRGRAPLLDLSSPSAAAGRTPAAPSMREPDRWTDRGGEEAEPAGVFARAAAVAIDLSILAAIDVIVLYFTVKICGLTWADLHILPKGPLMAFLLVQNGGYLVAFNAGGQTLGKMAAGIRVVSTRGTASVDVAHAMLRTAVWFVLAVPAGLGFVTALFSSERRGLHDQFAGTRVVRSTPFA